MKKNEKPVRIEQLLNASVETVWKAITDIDLMRQWYFDNIPAFMAEVGFETQFSIKSGERDFLHIWKVTEVVQLKKITYNWQYEDYPGDANVTFELRPQNELTKLKLSLEVLEDFPDDIPEFSRESCIGGWTYFINQRLRAFLDQHE